MSVGTTVVANLAAKLLLDTTGFSSNIDTATNKTRKLADLLASLGFIKGVKKVTESAMEFETAFAGVMKTVDAPEGKDAEKFFSDLNDTILESTKTLPIAATELAGIYAIAGQLGIGAEDLKPFSDAMVMMAASTNLTAEEAANAFARFANVTHMDPKEFSNLGSSVVELGNNMAVSEKEIAEYTKRLALMGSMMGMPESDIVALAASIASLDLESASSSTALIRFTNQVTKAVTAFTGTSSEDLEMFASIANMTGDQLNALSDETGLSVKELKTLGDDYASAAKELSYFSEITGKTEEEFAKLWQDDATKALQSFFECFNRLTNEEQIAYLENLEIEQVNEQVVLRSLASGNNTLSKALEMSGTAWEDNTALTAEAEKAFGTTAAQTKLLQNDTERLAITAGTTLLPVIRDIIKDLRPLTENVTKFVSEHPELTKDILMIGAALGIIGIALQVINPIVSAFGKDGIIATIAKDVKDLAPEVKKLGGTILTDLWPNLVLAGEAITAFVATNPWIALAVAIAGVIALIILAVNNLGEADEATKQFAESVEKLDTASQTVTQNGYGQLEIVEYQYFEKDGQMVRDSGIQGWDGLPIYITQEEDLARAAENTTATLEEQTAAVTGLSDAAENLTLGDDLAESMTETKSAAEEAQDILTQMQEQLELFSGTSEQAESSGIAGAVDQFETLNSLLESDVFRQFANEPVDSTVSDSWVTFGDAVSKASDGFTAMSGMASEGRAVNFEPISEETLESWQSFAAALSDINKALNGDDEESFGLISVISEETLESWQNFAAVIDQINMAMAGNEDEGTLGLSETLSQLPDKFSAVKSAAEELVEPFSTKLPDATKTLLKHLCMTDDEGNANGGNTLYTALGEVKGLFEDIYSICQQLVSYWKNDMPKSIEQFKKDAGPLIETCNNIAAAAEAAAQMFDALAASIQNAISLANEFNAMNIGGGDGEFGGGRAAGGPVTSGTTYWVGEDGPEIFTPNRNGYIIPNKDLPSGGNEEPSIIINFNGDVIGDEASISAYVEKAARTAMWQEVALGA